VGTASSTERLRKTTFLVAVKTLVSVLFDRCKNEPDRVAFYDGSRHFTYGEVLRLLTSATRSLAKLGIVAGDRVAVTASNTPHFVATYFAIHGLGAVAVPIDPIIRQLTFDHIMSEAAPKLFVVSGQKLRSPVPEVGLEELLRTGEGAEGDLVDRTELSAVADILFTTGTSDKSKGVVLPHSALLHGAINTNAFLRASANDTEMLMAPLSHSFGLGRLRCMVHVGNTLVLDPTFLRSPGTALKRMAELRATGISAVPTGWEILRRLVGEELSRAVGQHLEYIEIGAAPMSPDLKKWLKSSFPKTRIFHNYGLTEAPRSAVTSFHEDGDDGACLGRASPNVSISIRDPDGHEVPVGSVGEIVIRSGAAMKEYLNLPELSRRAMTPFGFRSGDLGVMDDRGLLYLVSRMTDMINVGGLKVAPSEVEALINQYAGVTESACVGVSDQLEILGQCVKAFVVAREPIDPKQISAWLRTSGLDEFKVPRSYEFVESLPKTASGKLQRKLLLAPKGP
jgi:long-chain acyl-CoA synthetase